MALEALNSPTTASTSKFNHQQDDSWSKRKRSNRPRSSDDEYLAFCLLMLARGKNNNPDSNSNFNFKPLPTPPPLQTSSNQLSYSCKVCDKSFSTFQALGGHKASHRKSSNSAADQNPTHPPPASSAEIPSTSNNAARTHECSICHKTFSCGQALGGHKRCHYEGTINHHKNSTTTTLTTTTTQSQSRSQSRCDGLGFEFDLNLPASPELGSGEGSGAAKKSSREEEVESALPVKKPRLSLTLPVPHSD